MLKTTVIVIVTPSTRQSPRQGVLDGVGECVSDVQRPGDVGRRNHHHEDALGILLLHVSAILGLEKAAFLPPGIPSSFHILGVVPVGQNSVESTSNAG